MLSMENGRKAAIRRFFTRLDDRYKELSTSEIDSQLAKYLKKDSLLKIYKHLLDNRKTIEHNLLNFQNEHIVTLAYRIPKFKTTTSRTLNIVEDLEGELCLFVETKRKSNDDSKDSTIPIFSGGSRIAKPCWRIDSSTPEEWINLVAYGKNDVDKAIKDVNYSKILFKKAREINTDPDLPNPINYSLLGMPFENSKKSWELQISMYSPRACFTLLIATKTGQWTKFKDKDLVRMRKGVLLTLSALQQLNLTYEDIDDRNCLIYKNNDGYYLKFTDFETVGPVGQVGCVGNYEYASPEIFAVYSNIKSEYYSYYHGVSGDSYGLNQWKQSQSSIGNGNELALTDFANDMWSAGIILFQIKTGTKPQSFAHNEIKINADTIIKGLLQPIRNNRMTLYEAIEAFNKECIDKSPLALPEHSSPQRKPAQDLSIECTQQMENISLGSPSVNRASPILHAFQKQTTPSQAVEAIEVQMPQRTDSSAGNNKQQYCNQ